MKRLFFGFTLVAALISFSSFANERNIPDVLQSFYKTFRKAEGVNWTQVDDMIRIGFIMNGRQQFAYYSNDDLVVLATQIKTEELPEPLKTQLAEYNGVVTGTYELQKGPSKEYCVMLQNGSNHMILKGKNRWKVFVNDQI